MRINFAWITPLSIARLLVRAFMSTTWGGSGICHCCKTSFYWPLKWHVFDHVSASCTEEIDLPQSLKALRAAFQNQAGDCCWGSCNKGYWEKLDAFYSKKSTDEPREGHTTSIPDPLQGGDSCFSWKEAQKSPSKLRQKFATNFAENFANLVLNYVLGFWGPLKQRLHALASTKNKHRITMSLPSAEILSRVARQVPTKSRARSFFWVNLVEARQSHTKLFLHSSSRTLESCTSAPKIVDICIKMPGRPAVRVRNASGKSGPKVLSFNRFLLPWVIGGWPRYHTSTFFPKYLVFEFPKILSAFVTRAKKTAPG